jgi:hypothetical protein
LPSGWSVPFFVLGTAWVVTLGSCGGAEIVSEAFEGKDIVASGLEGISLAGAFLFPVAGLLLSVGAVFAGRWAARAAMLALTLLVALIGFACLMVGSKVDADITGAAVFAVILYAIPGMVVFVLLIVSIVMAVKEVRKSIEDSRRLRLEDLMSCRGEVSFATLAEELRLAPSGIADYVTGLVRAQELRAVVDSESQMVFSEERYARKERDLVSVVYGREQASLNDLTRELKLSQTRLVELLKASMQRGVFAGFVDWKQQLVSSAEVSTLRGAGSCPGCGGQMNLAGRGVEVCPFCRAEVFLA